MNSPVWHPFTQHGLGEPILEIERTKGAWLYSAQGRKILDGISSWWVTTHGHSHPRIQSAIARQASQMDQIIFAGFTHEPAERLAADLLKVMPASLSHVFFSDSGSTSVEVAIKMALGYWRNCGEPRHRIAVLDHSYHGDTIGAMSVGARGVFNQAYEPLLFDVESIPFPHIGQTQSTLDELERSCRGGSLAAFLVEPLILGAGGMLIYDASTLRSMHEICLRHDVLFIADEVMTGWGRTGSFLACDQADIEPDILCLSKGLTGGSLPLAATLAVPKVFAAHYSTDLEKLFFHSSSYAANPIACAAALANVAIWQEEPVLERVERLSRLQMEMLSELDAVSNPRQLGTITAFEIEGHENDYVSGIGIALRAFFLERDILLRPLGNTIYVMPPYCIGKAEMRSIYDAIGEALERYA